MPINERLKELRELRRLSMAELARLVGVDRKTIWYIEHGERGVGLDIAKRLARALGVSLDELAEMDEEG